MLTKVFALIAIAIVGITLYSAYTQPSAFMLRQEQQALYWPRYRTSISGRYHRGSWQPLPSRREFDTFRGGGPSVGK